MRTRAGAGALVVCLVAATSAAARAPIHALVILPPGEGSSVTMAAFARNQASGNCADLGPHVCDQLYLYRDWRMRDATLAATPSAVQGASSSESPQSGVEIVRDNWGVPHIFATGGSEQLIELRIAYGIGYAQAEERLFQMEVLRRAAEGHLAELLGPAYVEMDVITRRD